MANSKISVSKVQLRALKDLKVESTMFGPTLTYAEKTGRALVNKGFAEIIDEGPCTSASKRHSRNWCITAKITQKGKEFLKSR